MKNNVCKCRAYPFPHRQGSGKCFAFNGSLFCGACGHPCTIHTEDVGIGRYEFWGTGEVHRKVIVLSDCCSYLVFKNANLTRRYTTDDLIEDNATNHYDSKSLD